MSYLYLLLEMHPYFVKKETVDNCKGHLYGFDKVVYTKYIYNDPSGGVLFIYIPLSEGKLQWAYTFPNGNGFIQKIACPYSNGPGWIASIIEKAENILKHSRNK
jgi:hypothetical protein